MITCGHNARFEFRNVSTVTVSGLEFVGCFENHVVSVSPFQLENSGFFGNGQARINSTILTVKNSVANLDGAVFLSAIETLQNSTISQEAGDSCTTITSNIRVIGLLVKRTNIGIIQSWFEGNHVGLGGALIYDEYGSNIKIDNTTFVNNTASSDSNFTSSLVYSNSSIKIYNSKFRENDGVLIFGENSCMLITHTVVTKNTNSAHFTHTIYVTNDVIFSVVFSYALVINTGGV